MVRTYSSSERLDDGVVGGGGLGLSEPDPGLVGAEEDVVVGEAGHDAVVLGLGDHGVASPGVVEADAGQDPLDVEVLADLEAGRPVQGNAVVDLLQTDRVPVLGVLVALDELDGA